MLSDEFSERRDMEKAAFKASWPGPKLKYFIEQYFDSRTRIRHKTSFLGDISDN